MKKFIIEIKWALIFVAMMLLWMLLERLFGLHDRYIEYHPLVTNFVAIPAILIYVLALLDKRHNYYHGQMSYLQGFVSGVIITVIVTILSPLTQIITSLIITPDYFRNVIEYTISTGAMSRVEAEEYFTLNNYLVQTILFTPAMGIFTSSIVAIFTRRTNADGL
ncbi:MAG: DUF4199 domain-containing protein [Bacteroidales bacterium]|nr:DUF4199 domain-containing protein [Bacteroidales bacterium]